MQVSLQEAVRQRLSSQITSSDAFRMQPIGGGSINDAYQISYAGKLLFCKINSATKFPHLFESEKQGLHLLAQQQRINTPAVVDCFEAEGQQMLLLQWVQEGERTEGFWQMFGEQLASLHRVTQKTFGLDHDNFMGSVPQANNPHESWCSFFPAERLMPMVKRCADNKLLNTSHVRQFESLYQRLPDFFEEEPPSLLHGDLWSGNFLCNQQSEPVLIDPAVYFGHRSVDLAMTTLFGGFRPAFYEAYHYHFPLPNNYKEQWAVCNLYPLLIHLYLFGTSYLPQIERTLNQFAG